MIILFLLGLVFVIASLLAYIFPYYYISDLILSFAPYLIALSFVGLIVSLIVLRRQIKKSLFATISLKKIGLGILIVGFGLVFLLFSRKFTTFYNFPVEELSSDMSDGVKVLYANIYKDNKNYTGIQDLIDKENPDLIFFVEFSQHHYEALKTLLKAHYPYTNSTIWSNKFVGNVVFSKIKIENWADDFPQDAWRYGYFSIKHDTTPLYFYLPHMSSPSSKKNFDMRNKQILTFLNDFNIHRNLHRTRGDKVVLVGDFNTTPWSPWYWRFADVFEGEFVNITRSFPILFTWKLLNFPVLWAHIDHIFVNKEVSISDLHQVNVPGSDHKGFSFEVK